MFGELLIYLPIVLMVALLAIGVPIAFSMAISGLLGLYFVFGAEQTTGTLSTVAHAETTVFLYTTIPMFILMAEFINESNLTEYIFDAGQKWLANIPGGLAIATTIANGGFAVLSGSSLAAAATMSSIAVPEMRKYGYKDTIAMGTVSAAGTFAAMLPPSLALIIYGVWTETSIAALFIAGVVPGVLTLAGYVVVILIWNSQDSDLTSGRQSYSWNERFASLKPIWPTTIIVVLVLGGLYSGAVTATEAGAIGAAGAFLVAILILGMSMEETNDALARAARTTAMIFFIIIGAVIFTRYMAYTRLTQDIVNFINGLPVGVLGTVIILLTIYILLGTFMDQIAVLILTLPITFPLFVHEFGYSAVWFGIVLIKTVEIGLVTPPLGMNVYVASSTVDVDIGDAFRGASVFLTVDIVILAAMIAFPEMVMWLPDLMMG
ncbi:TRAP transporter large permease [Natrarchaeobius sp. A-rgal3]|uniref:TRAP transporter large permease n=1 Tax=Natrarchaeobius versutus TaxID=1679078 RepID=UPI00350FDFA5